MKPESACWKNTQIVELDNTTAELWRLHDVRVQSEEFYKIEDLGRLLFELALIDRLRYEIWHI